MNVREIALRSLLAICKDEGYSNIVVSQAIQKYKMEDRDRRFYTELVYGTLRYINYLDWIVSKISTRKLNKLDPLCLAIVRLGLYQIFGMTKVPESAACNESVKLATRLGNKGMAGFVNAMLRSSLRRRQEFSIPTMEEDPLLHLTLTYHQQDWLVKAWIKEYGLAETEALCRYFDSIPVLCLRTNTARVSRDELIAQLAEEGIQAEKAAYAPEGVYLPDIPNIGSVKALKKGLAIL